MIYIKLYLKNDLRIDIILKMIFKKKLYIRYMWLYPQLWVQLQSLTKQSLIKNKKLTFL